MPRPMDTVKRKREIIRKLIRNSLQTRSRVIQLELMDRAFSEACWASGIAAWRRDIAKGRR